MKIQKIRVESTIKITCRRNPYSLQKKSILPAEENFAISQSEFRDNSKRCLIGTDKKRGCEITPSLESIE